MDIVKAVQGVFSWIGSFFMEIGKVFQNFGQWFFDTLLKPFFDGVTSFFKTIGDFLEGLWNFICDIFKYLFVPKDGFFDSKISSTTSNVSSKVGIDVTTLESLKGVASRSTRAPINFILNFNLMGQDVHIDLNFIKQAAPYSQALFMGLSSIFLCWYNFKNVLRLFGKGAVESSQGGNEK